MCFSRKHLPSFGQKNAQPAACGPNDSMLAINNTTAPELCMHHFKTGSSWLPEAIQAVRPPPFLFNCALILDSNQYLKAEFRNDK